MIGYKIGAVVVLVAAAAWGGFIKGEANQKVLREKDRLAWQLKFDAVAAESKRREEEIRAGQEEIVDDYKAKVEGFERDVGGLTRRLHRATNVASGCTMPQDAFATGGDSGGGVLSGIEEIERDSDAAWSAAGRAAAGLTACREAYREAEKVINRELH